MRGSYVESAESLTNSIDNCLNPEIKLAATNKLWHLTTLGTYASCVTLSMAFFGKDDEEGLTLFLKSFVDRPELGLDFSTVSGKLKEYRDIIAHRWYSERGYEVGTDETMPVGWRFDGGVTYINRKIFTEAYLAAFDNGGKIWDYNSIVQGKEVQVKKRMVKRYTSVKFNKV